MLDMRTAEVRVRGNLGWTTFFVTLDLEVGMHDDCLPRVSSIQSN
jgi:hypothetical protein